MTVLGAKTTARPTLSRDTAAARGLFMAPVALLPLVAFIPGASQSFGLPRWLLFASCLLVGILHGTDWVYRDAELGDEHWGVRAELVSWCAVVVVARGPTPMAWAFPYFAALFAAQRVGRNPLTCALLLIACVGANLARAVLWDPLPVAAVAHSLGPSLVYWLLGGGVHTALEERSHIQSLIAEEERAMTRRTRLALARDVHDGTGALLVAAAAQTDLALRARACQPERSARAARRAHALLTLAHAEARMFEQPLPGSWEQAFGWLEELVHALAPLGTLSAHACAPQAAPPPQVWRVLRCITTEAVNNAIRHGNASHVRVRIGIDANLLELRVLDDGRGLEGSVAGFGRRSILERALALGGTAEWTSGAATGTELRVTLPLGTDQAR